MTMLKLSSLGRLSFGMAGAIAGLIGITVPSLATEATPSFTEASNTSTVAQLETSSLHQWVAQASARLSLAQHLDSIGARMYGAYWCPYCDRQADMFGDAFSEIEYIECDPRGENAQPQLCRSAGIQGYPTWEIDGQFYAGMRSLEELATLSGYSGPTDF